MTSSITNALIDVRKAYRLLADYQQRVVELLSVVREELGARHYHHHCRNQTPRDLARLERSNDGGKRLLPFNDISVLWLRDGGQEDPVHHHQKGDLLIDVWVRSDTGNGESGEPKLAPEQSDSELRIYFFLCIDPSKESCNWYYKIWSCTDYPELGKVSTCDGNPGYRAYGEVLKLSDLSDAASVRHAITGLRERASVMFEQLV